MDASDPTDDAPATRPPDAHPPARERKPGDGWVECLCGRRHWGLVGAAGLALFRRGLDGAPEAIALQHRAVWSDAGGTWGVPGGALQPGEPPLAGALREAAEEAGIEPGDVHPIGERILDHDRWRYTTVLAVVADQAVPFPRATDIESIEVRWIPVDGVTDLALMPAFGRAWPQLRAYATAWAARNPV